MAHLLDAAARGQASEQTEADARHDEDADCGKAEGDDGRPRLERSRESLAFQQVNDDEADPEGEQNSFADMTPDHCALLLRSA
ncbi:hypothetical protein [Cohnella rhizosphaerae]|uniref:Uncharacterized protein n=1 Tax=Cohnella rhizosphaerae TaxID=1457232 RepID=A0A9X4KQW3_9BACL|nr:hypothetical protein [Cohnella rhizosphaerae]MDG0808561.1 hypothetical protein [Cohnella rhizosphaerae]